MSNGAEVFLRLKAPVWRISCSRALSVPNGEGQRRLDFNVFNFNFNFHLPTKHSPRSVDLSPSGFIGTLAPTAFSVR